MLLLLRLVLIAVAAGYLAIVLYMYLQQRSLQYFPSHRAPSPAEAGLSGVSEQTIGTPDGERLAAWYAPARDGQPTILFLHGNGGEIGDRSGRMAFYQSQGFGVLFLSYRGYGASSGSISEKGFVTDALAAHDWLQEQGIPARRIAVVGESLGTGVAVQLAVRREIGALALEAPFTAAADIGAEIYWWLPVRLLMKDPFYSRKVIDQVKVPLLIQHGDADTVIPLSHGQRLFALANEPKEMAVLPGAGHEVLSEPEVLARELDFFTRHMPAQ